MTGAWERSYQDCRLLSFYLVMVISPWESRRKRGFLFFLPLPFPLPLPLLQADSLLVLTEWDTILLHPSSSVPLLAAGNHCHTASLDWCSNRCACHLVIMGLAGVLGAHHECQGHRRSKAGEGATRKEAALQQSGLQLPPPRVPPSSLFRWPLCVSRNRSVPFSIFGSPAIWPDGAICWW